MVHADIMINMFLSSGTTDAPLFSNVTSQQKVSGLIPTSVYVRDFKYLSLKHAN